MPKGHTNNPHGRKSGSPNKITAEIRETLLNAFKGEILNISNTLQSLEARERIEMLVKFMPYLLPKLQNIDITQAEKTEDDLIIEWQSMQPPNVTFVCADMSKPPDV